jgi:hypothetical protein
VAAIGRPIIGADPARARIGASAGAGPGMSTSASRSCRVVQSPSTMVVVDNGGNHMIMLRQIVRLCPIDGLSRDISGHTAWRGGLGEKKTRRRAKDQNTVGESVHCGSPCRVDEYLNSTPRWTAPAMQIRNRPRVPIDFGKPFEPRR